VTATTLARATGSRWLGLQGPGTGRHICTQPGGGGVVLTPSAAAMCKNGESAGEHRHTGVDVREQNVMT
jgi:hypothetical protein